jgi:hypothetical protein
LLRLYEKHAPSRKSMRACDIAPADAHLRCCCCCCCCSVTRLQTQHFKDNRASFDLQAREMTRRHAVAHVTADPEAAASASAAASAAASDSAAVAATPAAASVAATAVAPSAAASATGSSVAADDTKRASTPSPPAGSSDLALHVASGSKRPVSPNASEDVPSDAKKQRTEQATPDTAGAAAGPPAILPAQSVEQS